MRNSVLNLGELVRKTRKNLGLTQKDLALTAGTGQRFIVDLEKGKPTCQIGKTLTVLQTLGIKIQFVAPSTPEMMKDHTS